eukprot:gene1589-966_t
MTMQEPDDNAHPSIELMVRIIEEELWAENKDSHNIIKAIPEQSTDHTRYLQEKLYPTLVPALFEMLKLEQKEQQRSEPSGKYGATGNVDPITWLAHYLLRNNATSNTSRIRHHPYAIVNSVFLAKQQENKDEELSVALLSVCYLIIQSETPTMRIVFNRDDDENFGKINFFYVIHLLSLLVLIT